MFYAMHQNKFIPCNIQRENHYRYEKIFIWDKCQHLKTRLRIIACVIAKLLLVSGNYLFYTKFFVLYFIM